MHELDVAPYESVFVGDSPVHDIGGAKAAGMWAVLTRQYVARPYDAGSPQAAAVIEHLSELSEVIDAFVASTPSAGTR
jgi:FMN phosphatase YigB (HAD superfamily)